MHFVHFSFSTSVSLLLTTRQLSLERDRKSSGGARDRPGGKDHPVSGADFWPVGIGSEMVGLACWCPSLGRAARSGNEVGNPAHIKQRVTGACFPVVVLLKELPAPKADSCGMKRVGVRKRAQRESHKPGPLSSCCPHH